MDAILTQDLIDTLIDRLRVVIREEVKREVSGDQEPLLSIREACAFLDCTPPTFRAMRRSFNIPEHYVGSRPKFNKSDLLVARDNAPKYRRDNA